MKWTLGGTPRMRALGVIALAVIALVLATRNGSRAAQVAPDIARRMDPIKILLTDKDQERDYRSDLEILAQDQTEKQRGWRFEKLFHGDESRKWVALTFDDGPHPKWTPQLLATLKQLDVKATFFVVGEEAQFHPDLIRAEAAAGHEVSNHTYHHARLNHVRPDLIAPEIEACDAVLQVILDRPADAYLRPPGGEYDADVVDACKRLGKTIVLYTDDPADYLSPGVDKIVTRTVLRASPGGILLLHDGIEQTIEALPRIVEGLRAEGYRFVTIEEMDRATRSPAIRAYQKEAPSPEPRKAGFPRPQQQ